MVKLRFNRDELAVIDQAAKLMGLPRAAAARSLALRAVRAARKKQG